MLQWRYSLNLDGFATTAKVGGPPVQAKDPCGDGTILDSCSFVSAQGGWRQFYAVSWWQWKRFRRKERITSTVHSARITVSLSHVINLWSEPGQMEMKRQSLCIIFNNAKSLYLMFSYYEFDGSNAFQTSCDRDYKRLGELWNSHKHLLTFHNKPACSHRIQTHEVQKLVPRASWRTRSALLWQSLSTKTTWFRFRNDWWCRSCVWPSTTLGQYALCVQVI